MRFFKLGKHSIPALGFGTWQLAKETTAEAVETALMVGYMHLDCASAYGNQKEVGQGIKGRGMDREEIFITSKLWKSDMHKQDAIDACKRTLDELCVGYLDLYLMHWPDRSVPMDETLGALVELKEMGLIREYGVSNCTIHHLQDIMKKGYEPVCNQVEFHPSLNQKALMEFCDAQRIVLTAYSPIAQGADLQLPVIKELAKKYGRSESQIILNWIMSKGICAIPKASTRDHIEDNFKSLEFEMSGLEMAKIEGLNADNRVIQPEWAEFGY